MPPGAQRFEVISVSLPRDLLERTNALIPRTRRSRVISEVLASFLDSIARKQLEREYRAYYARRSARETREERNLLADWGLSDEEAWTILEREASGALRPAR
jgi:metal-responsive CopG/Arc/MetJ family transcriptional regulator